jgi:diketogulonate reductase-like aldo/keto reductase
VLIYQVLDLALTTGYRSFDTSAVYGNEKDIGLALKELLPKHKLKREDLFITSKLSPSDQGDRANSAIDTSLKNLNLAYLDLFLIHWPGASGIPSNSSDNKKLRNISWNALINAKRDGRLKAIGVSNYEIKHIEELVKDNGTKPDVNQVEWHPHWHQDDLLEYCKKQGIFLQAYSSLGSSNYKTLITDPTVKAIADKLKKSPAQVLLRWAVQQGVGVIPKARSKDHIEQNFQLDFVIPEEDMKTLSSMNNAHKYAWDPKVIA